MKKLPRSKKLTRQSFTCTPHEWRLIKTIAADLGISAAKYVRLLIIDQLHKSSPQDGSPYHGFEDTRTRGK